MSDDENFMEGNVADDQEMSVGDKPAFLPGIFLKVLKWTALIVAGVIFIVTVVVVTLKIMNRGASTQTYTAVSSEYQGEVPQYAWYSNIEEIRGRTSDLNPVTVMVKVNIGYDINNKALQTELITRSPRFKDMIRGYFSNKTAIELRPEHELEIKNELKEKINHILSSGKINEIIFTDFNVIEF